MFKELTPLFRYQPHEYAIKCCLSSVKKMKVFLLVFEANELGKEIYKEEILKVKMLYLRTKNRVFKNYSTCDCIKKLVDHFHYRL